VKPEQGFWRWLQPKLKTVPYLQVDRVENRVSKSMPDVSYTAGPPPNGVHGWIELKALVKESRTGGFTLPHYTPGQRSWIHRRGRAGGFVWLLLQTPEHVYLYDYMQAQTVKKFGKTDYTAKWSRRDFDVHDFATKIATDSRQWPR